MFIASQQFFYAAVVVVFFAADLSGIVGAQQYDSEGSLNSLYDSLLQREYAKPASIGNHRFERKAQRSTPSLRLRFGRSVQMPMPLMAINKRWFGDVNQKPIRSPSLRLRFGRRSDPLVPPEHILDDDTFVDDNSFYENYALAALFDRPIRKQPRLPWESITPFDSAEANYIYDDNEAEQYSKSNDLTNGFIKSEKIRNLLNAIRQMNENKSDFDEFERENRKPASLRLRWGRSTGVAGEVNSQQQKQQQSEAKTENIANKQRDDVPVTDKA